jgi:hypothetical protein
MQRITSNSRLLMKAKEAVLPTNISWLFRRDVVPWPLQSTRPP